MATPAPAPDTGCPDRATVRKVRPPRRRAGSAGSIAGAHRQRSHRLCRRRAAPRPPRGRLYRLPPHPPMPALQGCHDAALGFDCLERRPAGAGDLVGQRLDEPGAGGRVGDRAHVRLFHQHQLGVARLAPRERCRQPERIGEGAEDDRVGAPRRRAEAGEREPEHVGPDVARGEHPRRRARLDHRRRARRRRLRSSAPRSGARRGAWRWCGSIRPQQYAQVDLTERRSIPRPARASALA